MFDLITFVSEIKSPEVAAQAAQSVAFTTDVRLTSELRGVLKHIRENHGELGFDSPDAAQLALSEMQTTSLLLGEAGLVTHDIIETLKALYHQRTIWHRLARDLTSQTFRWDGSPWEYNIPHIDDVLDREVKLAVKPETERRVKLMAQVVGEELSEGDREKLQELTLQRHRQQAEERSRFMNKQNRALVSIFHTAVREDCVDVEANLDDLIELCPVRFDQLPDTARRAMMMAAQRGANKAQEFAMSDSSLTDGEYMALLVDSQRVQKQLTEQMKREPALA